VDLPLKGVQIPLFSPQHHIHCQYSFFIFHRLSPELGEMINAYDIWVGISEGKKPLRRPRHRWEDNIRMDLREIGLEGVNWMHLAQDRDQWQEGSCEHGNEPSGSIKMCFLTS
jgi:hypothetical protein